jgi:hypothetical protein
MSPGLPSSGSRRRHSWSPVSDRRPHRQLGNYRGVWLFRHHAALCLSAPPDSVRDLQTAVRAHTVQSLFSEAGVRALLGRRVAQLIGPVYQGYVERPSFRSVTHPAVRACSA